MESVKIKTTSIILYTCFLLLMSLHIQAQKNIAFSKVADSVTTYWAIAKFDIKKQKNNEQKKLFSNYLLAFNIDGPNTIVLMDTANEKLLMGHGKWKEIDGDKLLFALPFSLPDSNYRKAVQLLNRVFVKEQLSKNKVELKSVDKNGADIILVLEAYKPEYDTKKSNKK